MRSTKEETRKLEDCVCRWRGDFLTKFAQMLEFDAFPERKLSHLTFYCGCEHNTAIFSFCFFFPGSQYRSDNLRFKVKFL